MPENSSYELLWKRTYRPLKCGNAEIDVFDLDAEAASMTYIRGREFGIPMGSYTRLLVDGGVMMSDTPFEYRSNLPFLRRAEGKVLINGLGLGCCVDYLLKAKSDTAVEHITVIEKNEHVIKLIKAYLKKYCNSGKLTIIHADAFEYKPKKGERFNVVWHDIWPNMGTDNLPEMTKLHRQYGRRCDWQDSWQKEYLTRIKNSQKRNRFASWR